MLKAMGIEEEKIDQIIEAHSETVDALKEERDTYKADAEKLPDLTKELEKAKAAAKDSGEETVLKSEHDKIVKEYADFKAETEAKETRRQKERAIRELYKSVGISEKRIDSVMKVTSIDDFELDKDGKIKDVDKRTEAAKTEWADFIETTTTKGASTANPPANNGKGNGKTKAEILAMKDPAARQEAISQNPALFGI
jgi:hypothetical protein